MYDYFVKDHLGNTRVTLSEEENPVTYFTATMEPANSQVENTYYYNIDETRTAKPADYPPTDSVNNYVTGLDGKNKKLGSAILLKVSAGDKISIKANSWYKQSPGQNTGKPAVSSSLATLAANLLNGGATTSVAEGQVAGAAAGCSINPLAAALTTLISSRETDNPDKPRRPKAYVNWILLDDHLKPIPADTKPNVLKRKEYQGFDRVEKREN